MKNKIMKWKRYKIASVLFISIFLILAISAIAGFFILNQSNQKNIVTEKYCAYAGLFALVFAFLGGIFYEHKKNKMIEIVLSGKEVYFSDIDNLNFSDSEYIPEAEQPSMERAHRGGPGRETSGVRARKSSPIHV